jgi:hypothetical protein
MKTYTVTTYTIDEHPYPEKVYDWVRANWHGLGQDAVEEMVDSLKALRDAIGGRLDFALSLVPDRGEFVSLTDYDAEALAELLPRAGECPLTGMCYDADIIGALSADKLESRVLAVLHAEGGYTYSNEGIQEYVLANGYEFLASGEFYRGEK